MVAISKLPVLFIVYVFYTSIFFPYIKIIPSPTDVQPYCLILAGFIGALFIYSKSIYLKIPFEIMLLFFVFVFAVAVFFTISNLDFNSLRSLANYSSIFFICFSTYFVLKNQHGFSNNFLKYVIYFWFLIGLIQRFFYRDFMVSLIGRGFAEGQNWFRGVIGLAPEPTFYGLMCILLIFLAYFHFKGKNKLLIVLLLIQIFLFSMSSTTILLLCVFFIYYILIYFTSVRNLLKTVKIIVPLLLLLYGLLIFEKYINFSQTRFYGIASLLLENPLLIMQDESASDRIIHILFSFLGFFGNYFLPHGFGKWSEYIGGLYPDVLSYGTVVSVGGERIMSGYGAAFFELGLMGILIFISFNFALYRFYRNDIRKFLWISLCFNTVLLTSIQLANPILGFIIGYLAYYSRNLNIEKKNPKSINRGPRACPRVIEA